MGQNQVYAFEQYTRGAADVGQQALDRELAALRSLGSSDNGLIIKLLGAFEHRGQYSKIFPLAQDDLRHYWASFESSAVTPQ